MLPDGGVYQGAGEADESQCTYRCVVLPDEIERFRLLIEKVSMHLQVRGAP